MFSGNSNSWPAMFPARPAAVGDGARWFLVAASGEAPLVGGEVRRLPEREIDEEAAEKMIGASGSNQ